ncbi:MAG: hypothetical protein AAFX87_12380 [Bacteroidota bacterium]
MKRYADQSRVNPLFDSYINYRFLWTKSAYFESLVSKGDFKHLEGRLDRSVFSKVKEYQDGISSEFENYLFNNPEGRAWGETLFRFHDKYIYAYFNVKEQRYLIVSFD